jgi:L-aspartate oxidase
VQFHPTALDVAGAPPFLLSEALRGEGAHLLNCTGQRFMPAYHPLAELAPRDVVARAIIVELRERGPVLLDLRHLDGAFLKTRFPRIYETCLAYGLDFTTQPIPIHPAAHYAMGGIRTDLEGRTSLPRLYAAGEVAATGVHGANRLASNSLLEGVVFGARAGAAMREWSGSACPAAPMPPEPSFPQTSPARLGALAWECCGIIRNGADLERAIGILNAVPLVPTSNPNRALFELRSIHTVAGLIAQCALARAESRGAHYRTDCPAPLPEFQKHSIVSSLKGVRFE